MAEALKAPSVEDISGYGAEGKCRQEKMANACEAFSSVYVKSVESVCVPPCIIQNRFEKSYRLFSFATTILAEHSLHYNENRSFLFLLI